eukprot:CAMPEP_0119008388 /NCGR_PEP_ID=MMETSP1176-20130426/3659_1 /TAXON_ID=265551 /ORGANISM="Synedropsis recta cf, Strain CCMP1620" /LENGTH=432 /DNA_ID=CAMNT_0006960707 /DNA_START=30 /DNA_END=1325 /DNA_ORIENTATION=-
MSSPPISGMAASIRAATESETFDLAGNNIATITNTIQSAFSTPFSLQGTMIRITFITGAGKLGRQKYDDGAAKAVTSTLRELGFEDDRGASCVVECAGSFKLQHDTGKNLKTVVVFPNIMEEAASNNIDNNNNNMAGLSIHNNEPESLLPEGSPESMIAMSSLQVFERMVASKCPSWSQKKGCVAAIESLKTLLHDVEATLLKGTPLTAAEQDYYDSMSLDVLQQKEDYCRKAMHAQVETTGSITRLERDMLLEQVSERLTKVQTELDDAADKPKKLEKLKSVREKVQQRKEMLAAIAPKAPHKLRHEVEIHKLLKEIMPLQQLEDSKGLLTVKETQQLGRKVEMEEQVAELEASSRGWFEDDEEAFEARLQLCRNAFAAKQKASGGKKKASSGYKAPTTTKFITPGGASRGGGGAWGAKAAKKPSKKKSPS